MERKGKSSHSGMLQEEIFKWKGSSRMAIKKHRRYGNFPGEESVSGQTRFFMFAECFHLYVSSLENKYKKYELVKNSVLKTP